MNDSDALNIAGGIRIPRSELRFRASRSGGPGGQHVNTSATRIELIWNVDDSPSVTDDQRARIRRRLAGRIDSKGELRLVASGSRSQAQNREEVVERFRRLIAGALREERPRRPTRVPGYAREARLRAKRHRSETKRRRQRVQDDE